MGASHREALASLCYGVKTGRGLLALIAPPGMGKTTLLFHFLAHLQRSARTAFLFQTQCDSNGLLHYMLRDLGVDTRGLDFVTMHDRLNEILLEEAHAGRRFVLVIDEAQNLSDTVLETARLLSDFETPNEKLLQIVFAGQPQLAEKLNRPELVQLRQRISILGRLKPFDATEANHYIHHRLQVAGHSGEDLFTPAAVASIALRSHGVPRNINNICFNALSLGCALGRKQIDVDLIDEVTRDLELSSLTDAGRPELGSTVSFPEPQTETRRGMQASTPELSLPSRIQSDDRSFAVQDDTAFVNEDDGFTLEVLEQAEARGAEILAEVVDFEVVLEVAVLRADEDPVDFRRELELRQGPHAPESWMQDAREDAAVVSATKNTLTAMHQSDGEIELQPQNLREETSRKNKESDLPISYSDAKRFRFRKWAFVAAVFILIGLTALFYQPNLQTSATRARQILMPTLANFTSSVRTIGIEFKQTFIATVRSSPSAARIAREHGKLFVSAEHALAPRVEDVALPNIEHHLPQPPITSGDVGRPQTLEQSKAVNSVVPVTVLRNDDLRHICLRHLGKFDQHVFEEIHELNPDVTNPDQIVVGQRIILPGSSRNENEQSAVAKTKP